MKPTVGRIVHYQAYGSPNGEYKSEPRAAIVTQVLENTTTEGAENQQTEGWVPNVGLAILNPTGMFFNPSIPYSAEPKAGHWSWPPKADLGLTTATAEKKTA